MVFQERVTAVAATEAVVIEVAAIAAGIVIEAPVTDIGDSIVCSSATLHLKLHLTM